ncbi:MAG: hypothetical protein H8E64_06885 [Candidatus Marinimicrobia bacterium]|nr:hypothetical protein [Candidatus Neomarinimicrobiota bacterium]
MPNESVIMNIKRISNLILSLIMLLFLYTCDENSEKQDEDIATPFWEQTTLDSGWVGAIASNKSGDIFVSITDKLFRSSNSGEDWIDLEVDFQVDHRLSYVNNISITRSGVVFVSTYNGMFSHLFKSNDIGSTWSHLTLPTLLDIRKITFNSSGHIFLVSPGSDESATGIFRSIDGGLNWTQMSLPTDYVYDFEISPGGDFFITSYEGVFGSTDDGINWVLLNNSIEDIYVDKIMVDSVNIIYVSTTDGLVRSSDNGQSWVYTNLLNPCLTFLVASPWGDVFAGIGRPCHDLEGIFVSKDNGDNWIQINGGLDTVDVRSAVIIPSGYILLGTWNGVYKSIAPIN